MSLFSRRALNDREKPPSPNLVFHEIPLTPSMLAAGCARLGLFSLLAACFCPLGMLSRGQAPPPACLQPLTGEIWEVVSCEEIYRQAFWSTASFASQLSSSHLDTVDSTTCSNVTSGDTPSLFYTIDCCRSIVHVHRFTEEQRPRLLFYCDLWRLTSKGVVRIKWS